MWNPLDGQLPSPPLEPMLRKLRQWRNLDDQEQQAVLALPCRVETIERDQSIVRKGDRPQYACLLIAGFAIGYRIVTDGSRSISALHMRGDMVDLQNTLLRNADNSVQTLSRCTIGLVPRDAIRDVAFAYPNVGMALWHDTFVDASILREWIANNARRKALARIAHLLCEIGLRLESAGLGDRHTYELPMTQEQLADCTGLTAVHVNRMIGELQARGGITRTLGHVAIVDWDRLSMISDFQDTYLHLPRPPASPVPDRVVDFPDSHS
jgi:CRP-like cAMP-binding protein